jgi:phosphorylase kinase alpha/beta subunit
MSEIPSISIEEGEKRTRLDSTSSTFHTMSADDLLSLLKEDKSLHDEADILHYLYEIKGLEWDVSKYFPNSKLKDLIVGVYDKASIRKMWWLVRHSAGMLGLRSEELAKVTLFL